MLNVRLNKEMEKKLKDYSQLNNLSKTDVVREALAMYFVNNPTVSSPFELGQDLFDQEGSDQSDRSVQYKNILKKKIREKHSH